jgi:ERCC4-type nuclease
MEVKPRIKTFEPGVPKIPDGFCLIIDTREQNPLFIKPPKGLYIVRDTLKVGDYSVKGFESLITIERKSLNDFYSSISSQRERFEEELKKMQELEWKALVIEEDEKKVLVPSPFETQIHPEVVRWSLVSLEVRWKLHIYMNRSRKDIERWILDRLIYFFKRKREGKF